MTEDFTPEQAAKLAEFEAAPYPAEVLLSHLRRPPAPSEPPADANGCPQQAHHGVDCPGDACRYAQPPAETQQDDEVERAAAAIADVDGYPRWAAILPPLQARYRRFARAALAARSSADTETLRGRIEKLAKQYQRLSEELHLVPAADAFHDAALDLQRALDGDR